LHEKTKVDKAASISPIEKGVDFCSFMDSFLKNGFNFSFLLFRPKPGAAAVVVVQTETTNECIYLS